MIKNSDDTALKNGQNMFRSQVVESFLTTTAYYYHYIYLGFSGVSINYPFKLYYQSPAGYRKYVYTVDSSNTSINIPQSSETSTKKFYTLGNLDALYSYRGTNSWATSYPYRGNLLKFMNQFPNLKTMSLEYSQFSQNLSDTRFPKKLTSLTLYDPTLTGDITTIENFNNIEELYLTSTPFTGTMTDINFNNLRKLSLNSTSNLGINFNNLFDNNPNLEYLYLPSSTIRYSGNSTTVDVSNLNYMYLNLTPASNFIGDITSWNFNTGLTYFYLNNRYSTADITNWDFSDTKVSSFTLIDYSQTNNKITGSLSNWILPNTLTSFTLQNISGMTSIPNNLTGATSLNTINISSCRGIKSISGTTFPSSLRYLIVSSCTNLEDDINNINFNDKILQITISSSKLTGDIGNFIIPSGVTSFQSQNNLLYGNITGMTLNNKLNYIYVNGNTNIYGNLIGMVFPDTLNQLLVNNTSVNLDLNAGVFNLNKISTLYMYSLYSGITGSLANINITNNISTFYMYNTNVDSDLSELDVSKISNFQAYDCGDIYGDLTNWLTGTTNLIGLDIHTNLGLSGDTSNWDVDDISDLRIYGTSLSGALTHNNVYNIYAYNTNISSNIETDFNFSNRGYNMRFDSCDLVGNLSGVTLYSGFYYFDISSNTGITGSNLFIDYLFEYRKFFTRSTVYIYIDDIGDVVTGATETLGDLGTYAGDPNGYDLTEEQVNNLIDGTDYDGLGTNVLWDSKQKIFWMKNAKTTSVSTTRRYISYQITY